MDMNAFYLHIASELGTNISLYAKDGAFLRQYSKRIDLRDPLREREDALHFLLSEDASEAPILSTVNRTITYALVEDRKQRYLIGPVLTDPSVGIQRDLTIQDLPEGFSSILNPVPTHTLVSHILLLHNSVNPPGLSTLELFNLRFSSELVESEARQRSTMEMFGRREYGELHNPYDNEFRLLASIENGNLSGLKVCWAEEYSGKLGITAKDPYRSGKNLAIGIVVLASRAAIRGGLHYETAFSLCDAYEIQIEELRDMSKLEALVKNAEYTFAEMVQNIRKTGTQSQDEESSPIIEGCKNYIHAHLHGKLTVQEMAGALHVHPNYLSSFFRKREGVSLYQYIINEKIRLAKNLLVYSSYSFLEIAHYLGFSSQSHLGTHFKKATGYTLKDYRDRYQYTRQEKLWMKQDVY